MGAFQERVQDDWFQDGMIAALIVAFVLSVFQWVEEETYFKVSAPENGYLVEVGDEGSR